MVGFQMCCALILLISAATQAAWPMIGRDVGGSFLSSQSVPVVNAINVFQVPLKNDTSFKDEEATGWVVLDSTGTLFASFNDTITTSSVNGEVGWSYTHPHPLVVSPARCGDLLLLADAVGDVTAIKAGAVVWTAQGSGPAQSPVCEEVNRTVFLVFENEVRALSYTGTPLWTASAGIRAHTEGESKTERQRGLVGRYTEVGRDCPIVRISPSIYLTGSSWHHLPF
jgi:hypothetical protein